MYRSNIFNLPLAAFHLYLKTTVLLAASALGSVRHQEQNSSVLPTSCTWPSGQHADRSLSGEYMFIQSLILMIVIQEAHQSFYFNKKIVRKYIFNYKSADNQVILTHPVTFDSLFGIMFYNVIRYWSPGLRGCSNLRLVLYYRNNSTFCVILDERGVV